MSIKAKSLIHDERAASRRRPLAVERLESRQLLSATPSFPADWLESSDLIASPISAWTGPQPLSVRGSYDLPAPPTGLRLQQEANAHAASAVLNPAAWAPELLQVEVAAGRIGLHEEFAADREISQLEPFRVRTSALDEVLMRSFDLYELLLEDRGYNSVALRSSLAPKLNVLEGESAWDSASDPLGSTKSPPARDALEPVNVAAAPSGALRGSEAVWVREVALNPPASYSAPTTHWLISLGPVEESAFVTIRSELRPQPPAAPGSPTPALAKSSLADGTALGASRPTDAARFDGVVADAAQNPTGWSRVSDASVASPYSVIAWFWPISNSAHAETRDELFSDRIRPASDEGFFDLQANRLRTSEAPALSNSLPATTPAVSLTGMSRSDTLETGWWWERLELTFRATRSTPVLSDLDDDGGDRDSRNAEGSPGLAATPTLRLEVPDDYEDGGLVVIETRGPTSRLAEEFVGVWPVGETPDARLSNMGQHVALDAVCGRVQAFELSTASAVEAPAAESPGSTETVVLPPADELHAPADSAADLKEESVRLEPNRVLLVPILVTLAHDVVVRRRRRGPPLETTESHE